LACLLADLLRQRQTTGIVETLLRYLLGADSRLGFERLGRTLKKREATETRDRIMSIAQELIERGRREGSARGRREGRQEGRQEGVQVGTLIGEIVTLQRLLGLKPASLTELAGEQVEELQRTAQKLRRRLPQAR